MVLNLDAKWFKDFSKDEFRSIFIGLKVNSPPSISVVDFFSDTYSLGRMWFCIWWCVSCFFKGWRLSLSFRRNWLRVWRFDNIWDILGSSAHPGKPRTLGRRGPQRRVSPPPSGVQEGHGPSSLHWTEGKTSQEPHDTTGVAWKKGVVMRWKLKAPLARYGQWVAETLMSPVAWITWAVFVCWASSAAANPVDILVAFGWVLRKVDS